MSKVKKVYQLRKIINNSKIQSQLSDNINKDYEENDNNNRISQANLNNQHEIINQSQFSQAKQIHQINDSNIIEGAQLTIDRLQLKFQQHVDCIDTAKVKICNIGSSVVYIEWLFKNKAKINQHAFKDLKAKFKCHYKLNAIQPGQEMIFVFSFISEIPGYFNQQCQLRCQPPIKTAIPNLKLHGKAYIQDEYTKIRDDFLNKIKQEANEQLVVEIINDIILKMQLPKPAKPDITNLKIAQELFQKNNENQRLYFNIIVHDWFNQLFCQVWKQAKKQDQPYWDQSIQTIKQLIDSTQIDQVNKICYHQRLQHYTHLSKFSNPEKSLLYSTIRNIVEESVYKLGGDYVDIARKQLEMWQIAFQQPLQQDTQQQQKIRKQQIEKIKSEWVKKMKKKKWNEQQQKEIIKQFKNKIQKKVIQNILISFINFENKSQYIKIIEKIKNNKNKFNKIKYFNFLQRIKTIIQYQIQGKKIMIKLKLKLKSNNIKQQIKQLQQYLIKKKQQQFKIEQQKKNQNIKKKKIIKKQIKKNNKNKQQQQQLKPLIFNFNSILDQQSWNGLLDTLHIVMQKQPFLILIAISYQTNNVDYKLPQNSVKFLLEHLKKVQPMIEFLPHQQLDNLKQKLEDQTINQGSIYLMENINLLPEEVMQEQITIPVQEQNEQSPGTVKRKLLYPQINNKLDKLRALVDVIVVQDCYLKHQSGITSYLKKDCILGTSAWKYVGISTRAVEATIVLGIDMKPVHLLLIKRLLQYAYKVYLAADIGLKFYMSANNLDSLGQTIIDSLTKNTIRQFLSFIQLSGQNKLLIIPQDWRLVSKVKHLESQQESEQKKVSFTQQIMNYSKDNQSMQKKQDYSNSIIIDLGMKSISEITAVNKGNFFIIGNTVVCQHELNKIDSLTEILKGIYKMHEAKKIRHAQQSNSINGINYDNDLVCYLVGIQKEQVERMDLKDRKQFKIKDNEEQQQQQQELQQQQIDDSEIPKIDLVADFRLSNMENINQLLMGQFNLALKDICRYNNN